MSINVNNKDGVTAELIRYTPKTINTAVQTSAQGASSTDTSTSHQTSTGSTQSTVNTFSVDASGGFFGSSPTGSLSLGYSRSWGSSQSQESSTGNSQGSGTSSSNSDSMTIKDWGCIAVQDLFKTDFSDATVVSVYLFPEINAKLLPKFRSELRPGTRVVSHQFGIGDWKPDRTETAWSGTMDHQLHLWVVPAR